MEYSTNSRMRRFTNGADSFDDRQEEFIVSPAPVEESDSRSELRKLYYTSVFAVENIGPEFEDGNVLRNSYKREVANLSEGCTMCDRNALRRKYEKIIEKLINDLE